MVSVKTTFLALASALLVAADYYINPSSVDLGTRKSWCADETYTCPIICQQIPPGGYIDNTCDPETLQYGCTCANGLQPNVSEYSVTLPFHVCQEWGNQCVKACGQNNACASDCREKHPCGALSPTRVNSTTSSTMSATASASATSGQVFAGFGGSSSQTGTQNAAAALRFGSVYGVAIVAGSLLFGTFLLL